MLQIKCPGCHNTLAIAAVPPGGGQVACPSCGRLMMLSAPVVPVKAVPIKAKPMPANDDDVIDLQQLPQPARPVMVARPVPAHPVMSPGASSTGRNKRPSTPQADADDSQEYRRPRKKKKAGKSNAPLLIGGGIVLALLIIVGVVLIITINGVNNKPAQVAINKDTNTPPKNTPRDEQPEGNGQSQPPKNNRGNDSNNNADKDKDSTPPNQNKNGSGSAKDDNSPSGTNTSSEAGGNDNTVQPPSFGGSSDGSGADVYPYVLKSATFIIAVMKDGRSVGAGSGSLIDRKNRLVLTNDHVAGDAKYVAVFFPNYDKNGKLVAEKRMFMDQFRDKKNVMQAKVIATNLTCDLCILQLPRLPDGVEALPLAKQSCRVGQRVHSIGNPGASGALWVYAPGVVRQTYHTTWRTLNDDRTFNTHTADVIETQSPTNHGDSGGPLVNDRGELVGVTHGGKSDGLSSISLFIDVTEVKRFVESAVQDQLHVQFTPDSRAPLNMGGVANNGAGGAMSSLPDLVKALEGTDNSAKAKAAESLGLMGEKARDAIPPLLKLLNDPDEFVRRTTMTALTKIGNPSKSDLPLLIAALGDRNVDMRRYAAMTLEKMGPDARSVSIELIAAIRDNDPVVRQAAARAVGLFGREVKDSAKGPLEEMLKDTDKDNRLAAAEGLAGILGASGDLEGLTRLLKNPDTDIRVFAVKACSKLGKNAKPLLGDLLNMTKDDFGDTRRAVINLLPQLDPNDAKLGINLVVESVKSGDKETRLAALKALGAIVKEVQPPMIAAIKDCMKEADLKIACVETLKKLSPTSKASLALLVELIKDDDAATSDAAVKAIIDLGPAASGAVGELIKLMDVSGNIVTPDDQVRVTKYAKVLAKIGKNAIPTLRKGLASRSITRWGCVKALGEIGPPAREVVRDLQVLMQQEPNEFIRRDIQEAIRKILDQ